MVYDLSLFGRHVEMTEHFIIVEGTDAGRTQPKCLSGEIQTMANSAGFKMHIAITTVSICAHSAIEITNHRKGHAGVTGQVLPEAQSSGGLSYSWCLNLDTVWIAVWNGDVTYESEFLAMGQLASGIVLI